MWKSNSCSIFLMCSYYCVCGLWNDWQTTRDFWSLLSPSSLQTWLVLTFQQIRCEYLLECMEYEATIYFFTLWTIEQCEFQNSSVLCILHLKDICLSLSFVSLYLSLTFSISLPPKTNGKVKWQRWHRQQQQYFPLDINLSTWITRR